MQYACYKEIDALGTIRLDLQQGSSEWLEARRSHITATDASVIMVENPWKTPYQLYEEKVNENFVAHVNEKMKRGIELESVARDLFCIKMQKVFFPCVIVKGWAMASLDGMSEDGTEIVEIKCPGEKDHQKAVNGSVPSHYYAQLQHQMYVCNVQKAHYFSFDGFDGAMVIVERDDDYIDKMIDKEFEFYQCLMNKTPPSKAPDLCIYRSDEEWVDLASRWRWLNDQMAHLQKEHDEVKEKLIQLAGKSDSKGAGIHVSQVSRKGNVDYSKIPELKTVHLDKYRKPDTTYWKISTL